MEDMKREQVRVPFGFLLFQEELVAHASNIPFLLFIICVLQGQLKVRIARIEESLELIMEIMQSRRPAVDRN